MKSTTLSDVYSKVNKKSKTRRVNDLYSTPPLATFALIKTHEPPENIIEPCAGMGYMSKELQLNGHNVWSFDLFEYDNTLVDISTSYDCLDHDYSLYDGVITNPPYKDDIPQKLINKTISKCNFTAMVLRTTFLESVGRNELFKSNPPTAVYILSDRMNCEFEHDLKNKQIGGMVSYSWFVWDKSKDYTNRIEWIKLRDFYDEWMRLSYNAYNTTI